MDFDIDKFWAKNQHKHVVRVVPLPDLNVPKPDNHTRFVCISDTHSKHTSIPFMPDGDVLIHAGDFSNVGTAKEILEFNEWLGTLKNKYRHIIVIAGNHDVTFDTENYENHLYKIFHQRRGVKQPFDSLQVKASLNNCTYIEDQLITVEGFTIYGSPWQPFFCDWGFNLYRDHTIQEKWKKIPDNVDILITHGPPLGHGDICIPANNRSGCHFLLEEVEQRIKPKYHIFGHIHEGFGITTNGVTNFVNASTCTYQYRPNNPPIVFDLPNKN